MRIIGLQASLRTFELDLLYSASQLKATGDPELGGFAAGALEQRAIFTNLTKRYSAIEDLETIGYARKGWADTRRDSTLLSMGHLMDSTDKGLIKRIMDITPAETTNLANNKETVAIDGILSRLQNLPPEHPVRVLYEARLGEENEAFKVVAEELGDIHERYTAARDAIRQAKVEADSFRVSLYGDLVMKMGQKEAESFFRRYSYSGAPVTDSDL